MLDKAPLKAIRFFESAARNLSFKKAAEELHVTPAAVGQQIKTLEEFLGVRLFVRLTRAIALTEQGKAIFPAISESLTKIDGTLEQLRAQPDLSILSVTTVHSFAAKWLFPRLGNFSLRHPDIDVRLTATRKVMDFDRDQIDLAVRIAPVDPQTPSLNSVFLFRESFIPVCSPELLEKGPPLNSPEDLRHHTLIHDDTMVIYQDCDWADLFKIWNITGVDATRGPRFNPSTMPIQAAINGLGVALARKALVRDDLAQGTLVAPFNLEMPSKVSYYLVYPKISRQLDKIELFKDWVLDEIEELHG